jgi:choline dehydrogenase-like flavoprotein
MRELNVPQLEDSMGGNNTGAFWFLLSLDPRNETRSTSQNFYTPNRPNLHLLTENQVTRVLFESHNSHLTVQGVEYSLGKGDETKQVLATREVILAAGALHTPQLLQLSGIGDTNRLSSLGIETLVNLPGVGLNYQDHPLLFTGQSGNCSMQSCSDRY